MEMTSARTLEGFIPDAGRGRELDERVHADLGASLAHLAEKSRDTLPEVGARIMAVSAAIREGRRVPPLTFRMYFRLVQALLVGDIEGVEKALGRIEDLGERHGARDVRYFGVPEADQISLELIEDGMRMAPVSESDARAFSALLDRGFDLMRRALPDLHEEIGGIVHEILLARAPLGDRTEFDGASHYQFWGLLLLNPKHHKTPLAVVEVLAHEASHSMLFGLTLKEPLVLNPDDERYPSPLRRDPRPMDGIYHAAYVSARMWWAMDQLSRSGLLSPEEKDLARRAADTDRENWKKGLSVIDAHARLSPTGARVLDAARASMASA